MVHHLSSKKLEVIITLLFVFILSSFPPSDSLLSPIIPKFYSKIIRKVKARENNQSNNLLTIAKMGKEDELFTTSAEDQVSLRTHPCLSLTIILFTN
jgi:ABC-type enterochelin transport system permease subunit